MEEGFIEDIYKRFIRLSDLNPLLIYDMTIWEVISYLEDKDTLGRDDLETEANIIRIAVSSAMNGKPIKLFEDKARANKGNLKSREEELKALDDLGI